MNDLFLFAAHNTMVAFGFGFCVYGLTRLWRHPALAHALWLLVLLKLVAPPVMRVDWSALLPAGSPNAQPISRADVVGNERPSAGPDRRPTSGSPGFLPSLGEAGGPMDRLNAERPASAAPAGRLADRIQSAWDGSRVWLFSTWLGGAILCALIAATRVLRFERLLKGTLPAPERFQRLAKEIAGKFNVRRIPDIRYVDCVDVPLLWCAGRRPTIVLPIGLLCQFDERQSAMILAHELAHLRRRDHWVRAVELFVSSIYWWNPLVGLIRRQIHQAEDFCCDAWVRLAFPDQEKNYAEVVLQTAESLNHSRLGARLLPASPFLHSLSLKARIEMILQSRFTPFISKRSMVAIALVALLVLPSFVQATRAEAQAPPADAPGVNTAFAKRALNEAQAAPAAKSNAPSSSDLPYAVHFEQGATRLPDCDAIRIVDVRGTAETFAPGNIYCIKGTYTLASHDRAMLAAFITAKDSVEGTSPYLKVQTATVNKGGGTFTLFLPMSCRGWPHVSFYPAGGGGDLGGTYFGTGDSVLKESWESGSVSSALRQIERLGGRIEREGPSDGPVTGIDFARSRLLKDQNIELLRSFKSLATVSLGHTGITDAGLEKIAELEKSKRGPRLADSRGQALRDLTTLYIDNTRITDSGLPALRHLPKLTTLGLGHTRTTDAGLHSVRDLANLTHLYLDNTQITDAGLTEIANLKNLAVLGLGHTRTTDAGLKTVCGFKKLTHLYVDNTQITDAGLVTIGQLKDLVTLGLGHTRITDAGLQNLKGLKNLAIVYLDHTLATAAGVQELGESLPDAKIIR